MKKTKNELKKKIIEVIYITLGVAIASLAFSFFLNPNNIVIGGVSGIGVILKYKFNNFDPALSILIANMILLIIGLIFVSKDFFLKTIYGAIMFPVFIALFDFIYKLIDYDFTKLDMVIIILFSALLMGLGIGISLKHGASTGGTEVLQKIFLKYLHMPFSRSVIILDGIVIVGGLFLKVNSLQTVLYAIVFTYLSGLVMDAVVFSGFSRRAVYIISEKNDEIASELLYKFERGVTGIKVIGEYKQSEKKMILCVLSASEYFKLRDIVNTLDPTAFMFTVRANEVRGEGFTYD